MLDTVLLQEVVVPSSGISLFLIFLETKSRFMAFRMSNRSDLCNKFHFFPFCTPFCVFPPQKGTRVAPRPLRRRAQPAKMPREAEARPKPSPETGWGGEGGAEE